MYHPETSVWRVKHQLPGRVRFAGEALHGDHRLARGIRTAINKLPGVKCCSTSCSTDTILVEYDQNIQSIESLFEAIRHAHRSRYKWEDTLEAREVEAIESVAQILARWDAQLRSISGGRV